MPFPKALTPQAQLVLEKLTRNGTRLDPLTAHMTLGVASLTARIAELRNAGHAIEGEWEVDHLNRRHMVYWIDKAEAQ